MKYNEVQDLFLKEGCIVPERKALAGSARETRFWIGWGNSRVSDRPSRDQAELSLYVPDFFLKSEKPWRIYPFFRKVGATELQAFLAQSATHPVQKRAWTAPHQPTFQATFEDLQARIRSKELKKAVPVVFAHCPGSPGPTEVARVLLQTMNKTEEYPLHVYGFWNGHEGLLGATPELLFEKRDTQVSTVALAGTRPHEASQRLPLLEDPKELEEHRFVIDGIVSALGDLGKTRIGTTTELRLQKFSHLLTSIDIQLDTDSSFDELVRLLHPTPALGAWPKQAGMTWLEGLQNSQARKRFGAPFGAQIPNQAELCWVAIRCLQWFMADNGSAVQMLGAGCGVTAQSEREREWEELQLKLDATQQALGL